MRTREQRREFTKNKYISRIKAELPFIRIKDGTTVNSYGYIIPNIRKPNSWKEAEEKCKWVKLLKHGKVYGRSTMNVLEKHFKVKKLRQESRKYEQQAMDSEISSSF